MYNCLAARAKANFFREQTGHSSDTEPKGAAHPRLRSSSPQPCRSDQPCRAAISIAAGLPWSMDVQRHQYDRPDGAAWSSPRLPQISMPALPHLPHGRAMAAASAYAWWTSWWSSSSHTPPFPRDRSSSPAAAKIPASSPRDERKLLMLLTFCGHLACLPGMRGGPSLRVSDKKRYPGR